MFNNLIYFLLVLLVFTAYQPAESPVLSPLTGLGLIILIYVLYWVLARTLFLRLKARIDGGAEASSMAYHRINRRLSILALILFTADVFGFGLKDLVMSVPLVAWSTAFEGLAGIVCFSVFLALMWGESFRVYASIYKTSLTRTRYVWSQLRFNMPIILPYMVLSIAVDIITLLPFDGLKAWVDSPVGELIFVLVFMSVLVVFLPPMIRPLWGLKPLPEGRARDIIVDFCRRSGFRYREIMLWPLYEGEGMTAGVMGLSPRWRFILITRSLLQVLNEEELEAVLAHEFGHVKKHHLALYLFIFLGFLVLAYALEMFMPLLFLLPPEMLEFLTGSGGWVFVQMTPMVLLMILYFRFVFGFYMRNFERQADLFAYRLTGSIQGLVSSLEKIAYYSGQSRNVPSWHHFSVAQRVRFLEECRVNPAEGAGHDRKVRRMMAGLCLALLLMGGFTYGFSQKGLGEDVNRRMAVRMLQTLISRNPHVPDLYFNLGNAYFEGKRYGEAIQAYERALALAPDNAEVLNNLAWALVTRPSPNREDRERGLALARKAAATNAAPHILDTLAEAYYVNGRAGLAARVIEQAMSLAGPSDDKDYFRKQKEKFEQADR